MLRPRWTAVSRSAAAASAAMADNMAAGQYIGKAVDRLSEPRILDLGASRRIRTMTTMNMSTHSNGRPLQGRHALVTGGSRGLGRALGHALGAAGARVVLVAREVAPLEEAAASIRRAGGQAWAV